MNAGQGDIAAQVVLESANCEADHTLLCTWQYKLVLVLHADCQAIEALHWQNAYVFGAVRAAAS